MPDKPYGEMTNDELIATMRRYATGSDSRYFPLRAELEQRNLMVQIAAAEAQVRSAWFQLAAVIAMFLTAVATVSAPWVARIAN